MSGPTPVDSAVLREMPLPEPQEGSKEDRGRVLAVGGSRDVPGALLLTGLGALRAGAGKLQLATVASRAAHLGLAMPEALVMELPETADGMIAASASQRLKRNAGACDALVLGPGMTNDADADALTRDLLLAAAEAGCVLDAGAMCGLDQLSPMLRDRAKPAIITPHSGEMASLLDCTREDVEADPLSAARDVAGQLGAVVVMKGSRTHIVAPDGAAWLFSGGSVGLGTSGSGDTLAGIVGGLLARGADSTTAAIWGVYLHGEAGRRLSRTIGTIGFLAREIPDLVPGLMDELRCS
jgi:ADP-dependent NAD(P)H-hydrate dehydratase